MEPIFAEAGRTEFVTDGGLRVTRTARPFDPAEMSAIASAIDHRCGGVLSSGMEYPGRYSRWHMAYVDPCIEITARGPLITARALNGRGGILLPVFAAAFGRAGTPLPREHGAAPGSGTQITVCIPQPSGLLPEEERTRRPTVFSALREVVAALRSADPNLGLYGAFGYDLAFQFEPVRLRHERPNDQRDLVLHLPDELYMVDRKRETALRYSYDFEVGTAASGTAASGTAASGTAASGTAASGTVRPAMPGGGRTHALPRTAPPAPPERAGVHPPHVPPPPVRGSYARIVADAKARFSRGDLFEVVPSQVFHHACGSPAAFYERLRHRNPAPYEFFFNLGDGEYLVGASPEMYVRVTGDRVETCPISGTIARGDDPLQDAANIRALLDSPKEESELTMCTDVDRNDKARVCVPGSVRVIGRRQIEMYSRLIHTVDHIEGRLRPGYDALDAFLTHMWAVTVTGAPKTWAMQFIEDHEEVPRRWYGGAVGKIGFDGSLNTGLTLRTAHIVNGVAAVRAGATLLYESDPQAEERETELKARALLETLAAGPADADDDPQRLPRDLPGATAGERAGAPLPGDGMTVLLVDHQDSFVNTLADYFRQLGATVTTLRAGFEPALLDQIGPDLVVLSPGPGWPSDFGCDALLKELDTRGLAAFGVCLGLQAMVEHAGGSLGLLPEPVHGKPAQVRRCARASGRLLDGLPPEFIAARYHSVHATSAQVRGGLRVTAVADDGAVMAVEDDAAGRWAVQFHPESILTMEGRTGHRVLANVLTLCRQRVGR